MTQIGEDTRSGLELAGLGVQHFLPVTGFTVVSRAEQAGTIAARMAADNDAVFKALQTLSKAAPYYELGQLAGAVVVAVGVDVGRINPDSFVSSALGVDVIAAEVRAAMEAETAGAVVFAATAPPPMAAAV